MAGGPTREQHEHVAQVFLKHMSHDQGKAFEDILADDIVADVPFPTQGPGKAGMIEIYHRARAAFPDAVWTKEYQIIEGDRQLLRFHAKGTHTGEFLGIPAKNNKIDLPALMIFKLNDQGQVVRQEMFMDGMALTMQMQA